MDEAVLPTRVYVECSETDRRVKATLLEKTERTVKVHMPTGFVLEMTKRHRRGRYLLACGTMEFYTDGKAVR